MVDCRWQCLEGRGCFLVQRHHDRVRANAPFSLGLSFRPPPLFPNQDLTRALELDPSDLLSYTRRAHAFRRMGEYEAAVGDYTKVCVRWGAGGHG